MSRTDDLEAQLERRQQQLKPVATTRTPSGQVLDWVPIESQTPDGSIASPPPAPTPAPGQHADRPTSSSSFEMHDLDRRDLGPDGTVPVLRPSAEALGVGPKRGGLLLNPDQRPQAAAHDTVEDPDPFRYFHCTAGQSTTSYGLDSLLNVWDPAVSGPGDDHSISQFWLLNFDKPKAQSVEAGWTVDQSLNGDTIAHCFTYFTTNGYEAEGDNIGGYNQHHQGWVQYDGTLHPGVRINGASTYGGQQLEVAMKFQLWQGNWWFALQNTWLGYYPASMFGGGIGDHASWNAFGGEIYSSAADPMTTTDQMGSGHHAEAWWTKAAYQRALRLQTDRAGTMASAASLSASTDTSSGAAGNYDMSYNLAGGPGWESYFFYGGPAA